MTEFATDRVNVNIIGHLRKSNLIISVDFYRTRNQEVLSIVDTFDTTGIILVSIALAILRYEIWY